MRIKSWLMLVLSMILIICTLAGCIDNSPKYDTVQEHVDAVMSDIRTKPYVLRIDDTAGASYIYAEDDYCIMYQPSHKNKVITQCNKIDGIWYVYGYIMNVKEDKYSSFTPKTFLDGDIIKATYIDPFYDAIILSEEKDKEKETMKISVDFGGAVETFRVDVSYKSFIEFERESVPTDIYMYYDGTKDYANIVEAILGELISADSKAGENFRKRTENILNGKKK
ncbi:hypothetical protein [Oribacterium sp. WCC10]|uniref:hypothetical protein n=1 Tax=Oribacterium sp. WCC10 TaxID=1855343 RepID=UPI0008DF4E69|nr:hypothetical protein [Oribacterium sp. WCC10]SFG42849.1 hypothetical protein SAMN05216356_10883 [Oribacterium sp. WCC10]